jgi:4-alpha-glucanotransferase
MFFEREPDGCFRPSSSYPKLALATADTHDMAPIAGFWAGHDIDVREKVGLIDSHQADADRRNREHDREQLLDRLAEEHVLPRDVAWTEPELIGAVHAMMCRTPAALVGLALDDLAAECDPVNVPGVGQDKHESWTRKMRDPLEVILVSDDTATALRCDGRRGIGDA